MALGGIPYPILSDFHPKGRVAELYGIYDQVKGTARRSVIIIDKTGMIRFKRIYTSAADIYTADILAEVDKLGG